MSLLVSEDFDVPASIGTDEFVLEPLTTDHVELDYAAVMESAEMLRRWSGTTWPEDGFTIEENLEDLQRHDREHRERVAFTYTVLTPAGDECLGCVYLNPVGRVVAADDPLMSDIAAGSAVLGFWVRQSRLGDGLERRLLATLRRWMSNAWRFPELFFVVHAGDVRQQAVFASAGSPSRRLVRGRHGGAVLFAWPEGPPQEFGQPPGLGRAWR